MRYQPSSLGQSTVAAPTNNLSVSYLDYTQEMLQVLDRPPAVNPWMNLNFSTVATLVPQVWVPTSPQPPLQESYSPRVFKQNFKRATLLANQKAEHPLLWSLVSLW